jgi:hypothetical protein
MPYEVRERGDLLVAENKKGDSVDPIIKSEFRIGVSNIAC